MRARGVSYRGTREGSEATAMSSFEQAAKQRLLGRRASLAARCDAGSATDQQELVEIDEALARLAAGRWGRCQMCGGAVGRDRLRALPHARFCLDCGDAS